MDDGSVFSPEVGTALDKELDQTSRDLFETDLIRESVHVKILILLFQVFWKKYAEKSLLRRIYIFF